MQITRKTRRFWSTLLALSLLAAGVVVPGTDAEAKQLAYQQHVVRMIPHGPGNYPPPAVARGCDALSLANNLVQDIQNKFYDGFAGLQAGSTTHDATVLYFDFFGFPNFPDFVTATARNGFRCGNSVSVTVSGNPGDLIFAIRIVTQ